MNVSIDKIEIVDRHRSDVGDVRDLAASIQRVGLMHPVVVTPEFRLVAGERRIAACRSLGLDEIPVTVVTCLADAADLLRAERDENVLRQPFTPSEAVALGRRLEALEKPKAKARQATSGNLPEVVRGNVRDVVAEAVGMSGRTYEKAKHVIDAATDPDVPDEVRKVAQEAADEMDRTGKVDPAHRAVRDAKTAARPKPRMKRYTVPVTNPVAVDRLVNQLGGMTIAVEQMLREGVSARDASEAAAWNDGLTAGIRALGHLRKHINNNQENNQ